MCRPHHHPRQPYPGSLTYATSGTSGTSGTGGRGVGHGEGGTTSRLWGFVCHPSGDLDARDVAVIAQALAYYRVAGGTRHMAGSSYVSCGKDE